MTSLATSLTVNRRSCLILFRTSVMVSFIFYVDGRPGRWSSSMDVRPSCFNQSNVTQRLSKTSTNVQFKSFRSIFTNFETKRVLHRNIIHREIAILYKTTNFERVLSMIKFQIMIIIIY